jgi:hypothetical protein
MCIYRLQESQEHGPTRYLLAQSYRERGSCPARTVCQNIADVGDTAGGARITKPVAKHELYVLQEEPRPFSKPLETCLQSLNMELAQGLSET